VLLLNNFYPVIPVYDDEGWNLESPPPYGDTTYLDASFYLVQAVAPETIVLAATGIEIARGVERGNQIVTLTAGPARDFYLAGGTKAEVYNSQAGEIVIRVFAGNSYQKATGRIGQYAADAIEIYSNRFGQFPYREIDIVLAPFESLGMEYSWCYSNILYIGISRIEKFRPIRKLFWKRLWRTRLRTSGFYNLVGNDQVDEPWLDEAFAQYATYLYYLDRYNLSAANSFRNSFWDRWIGLRNRNCLLGCPLPIMAKRNMSLSFMGAVRSSLWRWSRRWGRRCLVISCVIMSARQHGDRDD